eukprot:350976-Chlamydomonas_euryale.AAC.4
MYATFRAASDALASSQACAAAPGMLGMCCVVVASCATRHASRVMCHTSITPNITCTRLAWQPEART